MSSLGPTSFLDGVGYPSTTLYDKRLVAALDNISLADLLCRTRICPSSRAKSTRWGSSRSATLVSRNENDLEAREEEGLLDQRRLHTHCAESYPDSIGGGGDILSALSSFLGGCPTDDSVVLILAYLKVKITERVQQLTSFLVEINFTPRALRDQLGYLSSKFVASFNSMDLGTVVDKYVLWCHSLPRVEPFYAVKANPDDVITSSLYTLGAGFDCASQAELEQILAFPLDRSNRIIFANPCKQVEHILYAKEHGVDMMTFDNIYELDKIALHYPEARLVLRLLPDDSHSLMPFGAKFGASFCESQILMARCRDLNMNLIGVSFHVGSGCYSPTAWVEAVKLARDVFDEALKYGYVMNLVDIGGGFPGTEDGPLNVVTIGAMLGPVIDQLFDPDVRIIAEPGRFFCTEAVTLACKIVSKRERIVASSDNEPEREFQYYLTDGIYGSMNCVVFDHARLAPQLLVPDVAARAYRRTTMWGPTCDSIDVLVKGVPFPEANVGEWIYFENMGAYTSSAASRFNGFASPESVYTTSAFPGPRC